NLPMNFDLDQSNSSKDNGGEDSSGSVLVKLDGNVGECETAPEVMEDSEDDILIGSMTGKAIKKGKNVHL
ncbi:hypothetical protein ACHAO8_011606, partial [Botrytis cinerea]